MRIMTVGDFLKLTFSKDVAFSFYRDGSLSAINICVERNEKDFFYIGLSDELDFNSSDELMEFIDDVSLNKLGECEISHCIKRWGVLDYGDMVAVYSLSEIHSMVNKLSAILNQDT